MSENKKVSINIGKGLFFVFLALALIIGLFTSVYQVDAGERAVILSWGAPQPVAVSEGLHFKMPIRDKVVKIDVKTQKYETQASAATKDQQILPVTVAVNYHPVPESTPRLYQEIGLSYPDKVIYPAVQDVVKGVTAQYEASEFGASRPQISTAIRDALREELISKGVVLDDAFLVNYDFSPQYNAAIEAKETAKQNALAEQNKLAAIEFQAQQRVAQAEGEAAAIKAQAEAIRAQGGQEYVQLQWIAKWNGDVPSTVVGGDAGLFLQMPVSQSNPNSA